jgi:hypothetical protein
LSERLAVICFGQLRLDKRRPDLIRLPDSMHQAERILLGPTQTQNAIEANKGGNAHICRAVDPYATAGVAIHCVKERSQISFRRRTELHRYVDVIEAERFYRCSLIAQRVAWIVVKREIDYDVVARGRDCAKLIFGRLARRGQIRPSLAKVVHVVDG